MALTRYLFQRKLFGQSQPMNLGIVPDIDREGSVKENVLHPGGLRIGGSGLQQLRGPMRFFLFIVGPMACVRFDDDGRSLIGGIAQPDQRGSKHTGLLIE